MNDSVLMKVPLPQIDEESRGFWEACDREELYIQKCGDCGRLRHYPRALCPDCMSGDVRWLECSGNGIVHTFTVVHQNQAPGFRERVPYVLAYVELAEGVLMLSNLLGVEPEAVRIGMPVRVRFMQVEGGRKLPFFVPAERSGQDRD